MGSRHITKGERLGELGLCSLEKRRVKGHPTVVHKGSFLLRLVVAKHVLKLKRDRFRFGIRMIFFYNESAETLEQVEQKSCVGPIPGSV